MKRKEEAMKKYIASFLAICMIFVMVPILPAEAAGLEDTERVEILGQKATWTVGKQQS